MAITLQELESRLWDAANALRGSVDPADFKSHVFPMLFWKWLSDTWGWERNNAVEDFGEDVAAEVEADYHRFALPEWTRWGEATSDRWSVGGRTGGITEGDRAFLLRQGTDRRGIVASGHFTGGVFQDAHWDGSGRLANYAPVSFEVVLDPADRLPTEDLIAEVPGVPWSNLMQSGVQAESSAAVDLEELWSDHLDSVGFRSPEEVPEDETFPEGAVKQVLVNHYERNRKARQRCIERWGTDCFVCGFDFEVRYGKIGQGFIHVHHILELSQVGEEYEVDPEADLPPVCPNCHAMLHRRTPALSPSQLKRRLRPL